MCVCDCVCVCMCVHVRACVRVCMCARERVLANQCARACLGHWRAGLRKTASGGHRSALRPCRALGGGLLFAEAAG